MCMTQLASPYISFYARMLYNWLFCFSNQNDASLQPFLRKIQTKDIFLPHGTSINHFFKNNRSLRHFRSGLNFGQNKGNTLL